MTIANTGLIVEFKMLESSPNNVFLQWRDSDFNNGATKSYGSDPNDQTFTVVDLNLDAVENVFGAGTTQAMIDHIALALPNAEWEFQMWEHNGTADTGDTHNGWTIWAGWPHGTGWGSLADINVANLDNFLGSDDIQLVARLKGTETGTSDEGSSTEREVNNDNLKFIYDDVADTISVELAGGSVQTLATGITDIAGVKAFFESLFPNDSCFDFAFDTTTGVIRVKWVPTCDAGTWTFSQSLSDEINIGDEVNVSVMQHWPVTHRLLKT